MLNAEDRTRLEMVLDKTTLHDFLSALSVICYEKADHVESNWQDKNLARAWMKAGSKAEKFSDSTEI